MLETDIHVDWPQNYFNYFTEIEEHFRRVRGSGLFLLSPLDWALIETWKNSGVPLEAVLKGIDEAFDKWRSRKSKRRLVNSLAYCSQAILEAAQRAPASLRAAAASTAPFATEDLRNYLVRAAAELEKRSEPSLRDLAASLGLLAVNAENHIANLEDLERRLTSFEDKVVAIVRSTQSDEELYAIRESLDRELSPYRGKMTAEQLAMLEHRYLDTALLEKAKLPRLSLFYLH